MLRPTIARKIVRLRSARLLAPRLRFNSDSPITRVATELPTADRSKFPLYKAPPPGEEPEYDDFQWSGKLEDLPSEDDIKREIKKRVVNEAIKAVPEYSEEDLRSFYKNLVLSGKKDMIDNLPAIEAPKVPQEQRTPLIGELVKRLEAPKDAAESSEIAVTAPILPTNVPKHVAVTSALLQIAPEGPRSPFAIPLGLVTQSEWQALLDTFVSKGDGNGAEVLLSTMERHGVQPSVKQVDQIAELYAKRGLTAEVARYITELDEAGVEVTDHHRDLVILSYLGGDSPDVRGAIELLKQSEKIGKPFPQSSYNIVLERLSTRGLDRLPNAEERNMAWDLYAQMRFAAHPQPSREVYTTMIKACADPREPQPERARDLWIEMTVDNQVEPSGEEFNAIIHALGSTKADYLESFDLLRQMLAKHHDATWEPFAEEDVFAVSPWVPSRETFNALLEGAKRAGDLDRARWVLNEIVDLARSSRAYGPKAIEGPNEETMASIFMTYASWKPPRRRDQIQLAQWDGSEAALEEEAEVEAEAERRDLVESDRPEGSKSTAPQTSSDALREVDALFEQCLHDYQTAQAGQADPYTVPFAQVRPTTRLVNAYLSAHFVHGKSLAETRQVYDRVWAHLTDMFPHLRLRPNGWTYLEILQKCSRGSRGRMSKEDEAAARQWGADAWEEYRRWFASSSKQVSWAPDARSRRQRWLLGLDDRQTEAVWAAAIRLMTLKGDVEGALKIMLEFFERYPAADILRGYTPRVPGEFAIRYTDPRLVPESNIPPHLLFRDVAVLHQRCVIDENEEGLKKIKWVTSAYRNSLATRKKWRTRGGGVRRELAKLKKKGALTEPRPEALEDPKEEEAYPQ